MTIKFSKYHGTGNDFILIDNRTGEYSGISKIQIQSLCRRRFGIGADGLMLLNAHPDYDFEMEYYNPDGSGGTMCGNGGRCIVAFAKKLGLIKDKAHFTASDGAHFADILPNDEIKLKMNEVKSVDKINADFYCYTGSPHYVKQVKNVRELDVNSLGKAVRYSENYKKEGINVNFIEQTGEQQLFVRTYERGVEAETYSCGTGVTASALSFAYQNNIPQGEIKIKTLGGNLIVSFKKSANIYTDIYLQGKAEFVFEGSINLNR